MATERKSAADSLRQMADWLDAHPDAEKELTSAVVGFMNPPAALRDERKRLHDVIDPLLKSGRFSRKELYELISNHMGFSFHTATLRTVEEARKVREFLVTLN